MFYKDTEREDYSTASTPLYNTLGLAMKASPFGA